MPPQTNPTSRTPPLLFHGLPLNSFLGLDLLSLTASPNLHGIKTLPPGYHFLYSSSDASLSIRHGRWFLIAPPAAATAGQQSESQPLIWRWSKDNECLLPERDASAIERAGANLGRVWERGLLDYTQPGSGRDGGELESEWRELAGYVTDALLDRVLRPGGAGQGAEKRKDDSASRKFWSISSVSSAPQDLDEIPGLSASEAVVEGEEELGFLPIDLKRTWREGAVGRERTDAVRDRSWYLGHLIESAVGSGGDKRVGAAQLLGELQLCFLMVLTLANWSCLEQWKRILGVLLSCRQALVEVEDYFVAVVRLIKVQLKHCGDVEGGLFDFREEGAGWLKGLLAQFRRNVEEVFGSTSGEGLKAELKQLEDGLRDEYGWESRKDMLKRGLLELEDGERVDMDMNGADEEDETGEYAPVVVDLG
jgi:A1 cistron-splicing factor AAR2